MLCAIQDSYPRPPDYQARFIPTWLRRRPRDLEDHFIQMAMTAEKPTKLGHDQVTREACFVVVLYIFNNLSVVILHIKDGNDFSEFGRTEVNETQGYSISRYKFIHYFTRYADANQLSRDGCC